MPLSVAGPFAGSHTRCTALRLTCVDGGLLPAPVTPALPAEFLPPCLLFSGQGLLDLGAHRMLSNHLLGTQLGLPEEQCPQARLVESRCGAYVANRSPGCPKLSPSGLYLLHALGENCANLRLLLQGQFQSFLELFKLFHPAPFKIERPVPAMALSVCRGHGQTCEQECQGQGSQGVHDESPCRGGCLLLPLNPGICSIGRTSVAIGLPGEAKIMKFMSISALMRTLLCDCTVLRSGICDIFCLCDSL